MPLTPQILVDVETRMQIITELEYNRLTQRMWWPSMTKMRTSTGRKDTIQWLLSTAQIRHQGPKGGNIAYDDLVATYTEIENEFSGNGLELLKSEFEDSDGGGMDLAAQWSADTGAQMAYWPQKQAAYVLMNAHTNLFVGYDKQIFFSQAHPYNPLKTTLGTFSNLLTGSASGAYPGACPIDDSVTVDIALQNLSKIFAYVASWKMPNGVDPRFLRPRGLLVPPRLFPRAVQLASAKFIAQAAGSGAASADVEALITALGYATPVQADELAGFENDKTFFVIMEQLATSQLGGLIYTQREPFKIDYYGPLTQVELGRKQKLEWQNHGRNVMSAGHPYLLLKVQAT